jgi:hypothetical protein
VASRLAPQPTVESNASPDGSRLYPMPPFVLLVFFVFFEQIRFVLGSIRLPLDDFHVVETHAIFTEHLKDV